MLLYGTPLRTGWTRVIMTFVGPSGSSLTRPMTPELPALVNAAIDVMDQVPWLAHIINRNPILDGDGLFLHAVVGTGYMGGGLLNPAAGGYCCCRVMHARRVVPACCGGYWLSA
jgi:hypothetical protein